MSESYRAVKMTDHVYWVGAVDWALRDFHGHATPRGTTYNDYLVLADKVTLVDTVKAPFTDELLARVASVIDPAKIDYLISNHTEMDHSGGLPQVIAAVKPEKIFASTMGVKALAEHFRLSQEVQAVKDGEGLSLGNMDLAFVETRMVHWPDSMMTYLAQEQVLFSSDAFGMHLAGSERFADEVDDCALIEEARTYYANILLPLSPLVAKLLEKVAKLNLPLSMIATSHGPIWRRDPARILGLYADWAAGKKARKAVVTYDTMWESTAKMARAIADGLASGGVTVRVLPLRVASRSDVATEMLDAGALLVGSPTLNNGLFPTVADVLTYLKGLKPRNLVGAAFGSYGWSGEATRQLEEMLGEMKVELAAEALKVKYVPDDEALAASFALGSAVAERLGRETQS